MLMVNEDEDANDNDDNDWLLYLIAEELVVVKFKIPRYLSISIEYSERWLDTPHRSLSICLSNYAKISTIY